MTNLNAAGVVERILENRVADVGRAHRLHSNEEVEMAVREYL
jgi:hypothetical protein